MRSPLSAGAAAVGTLALALTLIAPVGASPPAVTQAATPGDEAAARRYLADVTWLADPAPRR